MFFFNPAPDKLHYTSPPSPQELAAQEAQQEVDKLNQLSSGDYTQAKIATLFLQPALVFWNIIRITDSSVSVFLTNMGWLPHIFNDLVELVALKVISDVLDKNAIDANKNAIDGAILKPIHSISDLTKWLQSFIADKLNDEFLSTEREHLIAFLNQLFKAVYRVAVYNHQEMTQDKCDHLSKQLWEFQQILNESLGIERYKANVSDYDEFKNRGGNKDYYWFLLTRIARVDNLEVELAQSRAHAGFITTDVVQLMQALRAEIIKTNRATDQRRAERAMLSREAGSSASSSSASSSSASSSSSVSSASSDDSDDQEEKHETLSWFKL